MTYSITFSVSCLKFDIFTTFKSYSAILVNKMISTLACIEYSGSEYSGEKNQ